MSAAGAGELRTLAFGELDAGLWGCAWAAGETCVAIAGKGTTASVLDDATLHGAGASEQWTLTGDGLELEALPVGDTADAQPLGGYDQLCRVRGAIRLPDGEHELEVLGRRASRAGIDVVALDSVRDVSAWFAPDDGLTLTALRPRGAKGHDRDVLAASVFGEDGARTVADPRLSSTYGHDGRLLHTGLELWLDAENDQQYPRRAAADALSNGAHVDVAGRTLSVWPLLWRSRGVEGAGIYVLFDGNR